MERGDVGSVTGGHFGVPVVPDPHGLIDSCVLTVKIIYVSFSLALLSFPLLPVLAMEGGVFLQARQVLVPWRYIPAPLMMINDSEMLAVHTSADVQRDSSLLPHYLTDSKETP
jgi:hypothetical protein